MKKILLFLSVFAVLSACTDEPVAVRVESIVFNLDVLQLTVGDSQSIDAVVLPDKAENKTLYWSSSNNSVATVTDGVVSALSSGESVITAISEDGGKKASCTVIVTPELIPVTGITIDRENLRIFIGNKHTLVAIVAPADASNKQVIWSSSDESVATVDKGVVTGVGLGNARITAETKEKGFKVECNVKVTEECQTQTKGPMTLNLGHVTATTAVIAGYLDVDLLADYDMTGGGVGFMYAPASEDFNISTAKKVQISNVDSENSFSHTLTGLSYDSQYQYTIFLYKNGILQLGETQTFKTNDVQILVENVAVTNTTATMSGSVVRSEADTEVKVGIMCSSTNSFSSNTKISKEVIPSDDGAYTLSFDKLDVDKEYYYRTYVYHKGIYEYGDVFTFTTNGISVDLDVKSKTQTTAMFTGKLLPTTAIDEATIGVLINTSRSVSNNNYSKKFIVSPEMVNSDGTFSFTMPGLKSNTTYYYTYYVLNNGKYAYGEIREFKTDEVQVSLSVANTTQTTATFTGSVVLTEKDEVEVGLVYSSTSSTPTINNSSRVLLTDIIDSHGAFSYKVNGLMNGRKHYYRYYLRQDGSYTYGDVLEFQTDVVPITLAVDNTTQTTVAFIGEAIFTEKDVIEVGLVYSSTSPSPTIDDSDKIVLTDTMALDGVFTCIIKGLLNGTEYFYRYYIEQNGSYIYANTETFTTSSVSVNLSIDSVTQTTAVFKGNVELTENGLIEVGVLYSTGSMLVDGADGVVKQNIIPDKNGTISFKAEGLQHAMNYNYCFYTYQDGKYTYGVVHTFATKPVSISLSVDTVTQTTATFKGKVELAEKEQIEVGVLYSTGDILFDGVNGAVKQVLNPDSNGIVSLKAEGLQHGTIYNFCHYVYQNGKYTYGATRTFSTKSVEVHLSVTTTTPTTAIFDGNVELTEEGLIEVGVLYSTGSSLYVGAPNVIKQTFTPDSGGIVSFKDETLQFAMSYNYCYYTGQNGKYTYGTIQRFTTLGWDSLINLSITGYANCYIVSKSGWYKIKTVKGNSTTSVGTVLTAEVLWESFGTSAKIFEGDLVEWISCKDDYVGFKVHDTFKEGNAVIAVKDASDNILWSWHIWLTDQPEGQIYNNNAGTMMDRNLGATSVTPGDVRALGLLYQWGRKDPFIGASSITSNSVAVSTITWPWEKWSSSSIGTIEYAIAHPTTFIIENEYNKDWYYTGSSSTDNTRWTSSGSKKSIYDPCPAGWRIPDGGSKGVWAKALGSSSKYAGLYDSSNKGVNFSGKLCAEANIWYPASGMFSYQSSLGLASVCLKYVGSGGSYWTASPYDGTYSKEAYIMDLSSSYVLPTFYGYRGNGMSVRCIKE